MPRLNLPNRITLGRLGSSLVLFGLLLVLQQGLVRDEQAVGWAAFATFVLTATTDWLDGHLARKRNQVTALGRMMDPFVDKVVVCGALVFLTAMLPRLVPPWMVVVIVSREFLVSGIRGYMESRGIAFGARMPGKVKMVLQCLAVSAVLLFCAIGVPARGEPRWLDTTCVVLLWLALLSTIYSGFTYARSFVASLGEGDS